MQPPPLTSAVVIPFPVRRRARLGAALLPASTGLQGALTALGLGLPLWVCLGAAVLIRG